MKRTFFVLLCFCFLSNSYSQNYDLIVNTEKDSIACFIDSIANSMIYFKMKNNNRWIHTTIDKDKVIEYKIGTIEKKQVLFKPNSSYIDFDYKKLDANLAKALKQKRTGKTLTKLGAITMGSGLLIGFIGGQSDNGGMVGAAIGGSIFLAGAGIELVGIPMRINGSEKIKSIKNTAMKINLVPNIQPSLMANNYQTGLSLIIKF